MSCDLAVLPAPLAHAQSRFADWRSTRVRRTERIPPALWKAAARCAVRFGVHRTARALGLDYVALKRQVAPAAKPARTGRGAFIELVPSLQPSAGECIVELENRSGARLRIELRGSAIPDLVELARRFGKEEP